MNATLEASKATNTKLNHDALKFMRIAPHGQGNIVVSLGTRFRNARLSENGGLDNRQTAVGMYQEMQRLLGDIIQGEVISGDTESQVGDISLDLERNRWQVIDEIFAMLNTATRTIVEERRMVEEELGKKIAAAQAAREEEALLS